MEDRETARMRKYGESKTTRIMMATVPHVTSSLGLRKFQANGFLLTRVYTVIGGAYDLGFMALWNPEPSQLHTTAHCFICTTISVILESTVLMPSVK